MILYQKVQSGEMRLLDDDDVVREIRLFIDHLDGIHSRLVSDHILNLLEDLAGTFPHDKERFLGIIDRYLALPNEERLIFKVGRRAGLFHCLDDLDDEATRLRVEEAVCRLREHGDGQVEEKLNSIMASYI
jgi:hypothetical protein